jgi:hypothetical protein
MPNEENIRDLQAREFEPLLNLKELTGAAEQRNPGHIRRLGSDEPVAGHSGQLPIMRGHH